VTRELAKSLHSPFAAAAVDYGRYEAARTRKALSTSVLAHPSKDMLDELRNLTSGIQKIVMSFKEASKRCCALTEGDSYYLITTNYG